MLVQASVARLFSRWGIALALTAALVSSTLTAANAAGGVNGTLRGTVVDQVTGKPIAGATVSVASPSGSFHATTDAHGFFNFLEIPTDTYVLAVERQGYSTFSETGVTVLGDQSQNIGTLHLTSSLRTIGATRVVARSSSAFQPNQTVDETTFTGSRVDQALGEKGSTDYSKLVLSAPGVIATQPNPNDPGHPFSIRGSSSVDIGYQFDGIDFRGAFFDEDAGQNFLNGVGDGRGGLEVVSGAGDATQGGIGAGVVNVIPGRGSYPGSGFVSADIGSPYFDHSLAFQYGTATKDGSLSEFFSMRADRQAPQIAPYGRDAADAGLSVYQGTSFTAKDDVLNNAYIRFGKKKDQTIQILARFWDTQEWAQYGGLKNAAYYPYNATSYAAFQSDTNGNSMWACAVAALCFNDPAKNSAPPDSTLVGDQQLAWYDSVIPYYGDTPHTNLQVSEPDPYIYGPENLFKIGYTRPLGDTAFLNAFFYNWGGQLATTITGVSQNFTDGQNPPGFDNTGGRNVGFQVSLTKQAGEKHLLTIVAKNENVHPYWQQQTYFNTWQGFTAVRNQEGVNAGMQAFAPFPNSLLGQSMATIAPLKYVPDNEASIEDWYLPQTPGQAIGPGNRCIGPARDNNYDPTAATNMGCYLYNYLQTHGKWTGTLPPIPSTGFDYGNSDFQQYGIGLRDQWSPSSKLHIDYGVRLDGQNLKWAPNPFTADLGNTADIGFGFAQLSDGYLHPKVYEPRISIDYVLNPHNSVRASYGRSAAFFFGQTGGTPTTESGVSPLLAGIPAKDTATLDPANNLLGPACGSGWHNGPANGNGAYTKNPFVPWSGSGTFPDQGGGAYFKCPSYISSVYWTFDQSFAAPDIGGQTVPTYNNWDLAWEHGFANGWGLKLTSYWRRGYNTGQTTLLSAGPPDPITGQQTAGAFEERETGVQKAFGEEFMLTTADKPFGLTGFVTANYINELTNTPPVAGQAALPAVAQYLYNSGSLWHQTYLPPLSARLGLVYKSRSGWKINPTIALDGGVPFGVGRDSVGYVNGVLYHVPTGNIGISTPYAGPGQPNQAYNATCYDDPAFAGNIFDPKYFACRGYSEPALAGQSFTRPRAFTDLNLEYSHNRFTYGVNISNLFDNYRAEPTINQFWQPVATGQGGLQTGISGASTNPVSLDGSPNALYVDGARDASLLDESWLPYNRLYAPGRTFRIYLQAEI